MKDVLKVDDVLYDIYMEFSQGIRSERTEDRMTAEDWEFSPDNADEET